MSGKNVYQRINDVMKEGADYLRKSKQVGTGSNAYNAVEYDALVAQIRGLFVKHGLVVTVNNQTAEVLDRKTNAGNATYLTQGRFEVRVTNIDDQNDFISMVSFGQGMDSGDKGANKAHTQATKQALMKLLLVETGDDEESRAADGEPQPESPTGVGADALDAIVTLIQQVPTVEELEKLHKANYVKADSALKARGTKDEKAVYLGAVRARKAQLEPNKGAA